MEITLLKVKKKFIDLLSDKISREEVDRWAYSIIQQEELGNLKFFPLKERDKIWAGVMYLYGIDIQESPGKYLHTKEDIRQALNEKIEHPTS